MPWRPRTRSRLREAAALRGPGAEPVGRAALARRLVEGSLDRAVDVAATLELRGHSLPGRTRPRREPLPRHRATARRRRPLIVTAAVAARLAGGGGFETYPAIELAADPATLALCVALPALACAPLPARCERSPSRAGLDGREVRVAEPAFSCEGLTYRYPEAGATRCGG